jgi:hypothetical protein
VCLKHITKNRRSQHLAKATSEELRISVRVVKVLVEVVIFGIKRLHT